MNTINTIKQKLGCSWVDAQMIWECSQYCLKKECFSNPFADELQKMTVIKEGTYKVGAKHIKVVTAKAEILLDKNGLVNPTQPISRKTIEKELFKAALEMRKTLYNCSLVTGESGCHFCYKSNLFHKIPKKISNEISSCIVFVKNWEEFLFRIEAFGTSWKTEQPNPKGWEIPEQLKEAERKLKEEWKKIERGTRPTHTQRECAAITKLAKQLGLSKIRTSVRYTAKEYTPTTFVKDGINYTIIV